MNNTEETHEPTAANPEPHASDESTVEETAAGAPGATEAVQADLDRFRDLALRTQADFENYRKRAVREREDAIKSATATLIERLLPVLDNFEFGLQAARNEGSQAVVVGFEMISRQLADFITESGVEVIDAEGQPFDHNLHDAIKQEASDTVPEGHVLRQLRRGYKYKDRLIRAANVVVSKGADGAEGAA